MKGIKRTDISKSLFLKRDPRVPTAGFVQIVMQCRPIRWLQVPSIRSGATMNN